MQVFLVEINQVHRLCDRLGTRSTLQDLQNSQVAASRHSISLKAKGMADVGETFRY